MRLVLLDLLIPLPLHYLAVMSQGSFVYLCYAWKMEMETNASILEGENKVKVKN
jgi:hypothetical protein